LEGLVALYQKYKRDDFIVLGFPSNQFLNQEPLSNDQLVTSCKINFGVTFPLSQKIKVNGKDTHPIFKYLKDNSPSSFITNAIKWNFTKFLISPEGELVKRYPPITKPEAIETDIVDLLP
jgi:glutathione peroxidase